MYALFDGGETRNIIAYYNSYGLDNMNLNEISSCWLTFLNDNLSCPSINNFSGEENTRNNLKLEQQQQVVYSHSIKIITSF